MSETAGLLERYRRGAVLVAVAVTGAAGSELDYAPDPERWSVRQILCHLADAELVAAVRFRQVLAEHEPLLSAVDGQAWARNLDYTRRRISQALETLRRTRTENYELLKDLPAAAWLRAGTLSEWGRLTLAGLLEREARHTEDHARQIRERRAEFKQARASGG